MTAQFILPRPWWTMPSSTVAQLTGLPLMHTLPPELVEMIRAYSQHSLFWWCISVLELAAYASATDSDDEPLRPLLPHNLHSWRRGASPQVAPGEVSPPVPVLRLTLDSLGIRQVERLSGLAPYEGVCATSSALVVQDAASLSGVTAHFKGTRRNMPYRNGYVAIDLNTPAPPDLALCKAYPADITSCQNFCAVLMDDIRSITFFFLSTRHLRGIYINRSDESSAWIRALATSPIVPGAALSGSPCQYPCVIKSVPSAFVSQFRPGAATS
jgi:hypothetical protein